jgi:predicted enzyme related to lactoylglutathione lyase
VDADVLFVGVAVADFAVARAWYERFFGRAPDVVAHDEEVLWRVTDRGWVYVLREAERAGRGIVAIAVPDVEEAVGALTRRGIAVGPIAAEGDAGRKAIVEDPEGNRLELLEVRAVT